MPHRLQRDFPEGLRLLGYDLPSTHLVAGQTLPLRLFWQAAKQPKQDYDLTVSFNGHSAQLALPATSRWQKDQLMETRLSLATQPDWAGSGRLGLSLDGSQPEVELPDTLTLDAPLRLTERLA